MCFKCCIIHVIWCIGQGCQVGGPLRFQRPPLLRGDVRGEDGCGSSLPYHTNDTIHASVCNALPTHPPHRTLHDRRDRGDALVFDVSINHDDLRRIASSLGNAFLSFKQISHNINLWSEDRCSSRRLVLEYFAANRAFGLKDGLDILPHLVIFIPNTCSQ